MTTTTTVTKPRKKASTKKLSSKTNKTTNKTKAHAGKADIIDFTSPAETELKLILDGLNKALG